MEMKVLNYICAIITALFIMVPDAKDYDLEAQIAVKDSVAIDRPPIDYEVEKRMREIELLKSEVQIEIKEVEIKNIKR